ncbi:hypothetical protein [Stigmatella aurantiaca]|uniref:Lipoprotein n=1 Tax=Stigmatella aurantiaca (strain DW4/3-1) TaxID=378806 RepID=Q08US3_STIAD|nr:hypothetical protein [Stigmatella aurantiaca]ADO71029.1 uncharacterized protein STAUR_3237 [Stigmatella aurantiaca DW4/3-1]EAU64229.1 hypothetical protein STIAU_4586 [Stigmatella aurantiaca DW4/3-1]
MRSHRPSFLRFLICLAASGATWGLLACGDSEPETFRRLLLESAGGPCSEEMDCQGSDEVLADGTFRVDRFNNPGSPILEVHLPENELKAVRETATDSRLLETLGRGEQPCPPVTDSSVRLTLELESTSYRAQIEGCDKPGLQEVRDLIQRLRETYAH